MQYGEVSAIGAESGSVTRPAILYYTILLAYGRLLQTIANGLIVHRSCRSFAKALALLEAVKNNPPVADGTFFQRDPCPCARAAHCMASVIITVVACALVPRLWSNLVTLSRTGSASNDSTTSTHVPL